MSTCPDGIWSMLKMVPIGVCMIYKANIMFGWLVEVVSLKASILWWDTINCFYQRCKILNVDPESKLYFFPLRTVSSFNGSLGPDCLLFSWERSQEKSVKESSIPPFFICLRHFFDIGATIFQALGKKRLLCCKLSPQDLQRLTAVQFPLLHQRCCSEKKAAIQPTHIFWKNL